MTSDPVLVTGATGFTGGYVARTLRRRGQRVRALVRKAGSAAALAKLGVDIVEGNLTDADAIERAVAGCAKVYHVAALYREANHPDSEYYRVNRDAADVLLRAARRHGVARFVHVSTAGVHGSVAQVPEDETAPYRPGDIYQLSKLEGEKLAQQAAKDGMPVSIVRPTGIFGPGDLRYFKMFRMVHRRKFRMFGSGATQHHTTYVQDLADGIILCGEHERAVGEVFIIGGDDYCSLNELTARIAAAVGVAPPRGRLPMWPLLLAAKACETVCVPLRIDPPLHTRRCEFFIKDRAFSNAKAKRLLGFAPKTPLATGLLRTAKWYFDQGLLGGTMPEATRAARYGDDEGTM